MSEQKRKAIETLEKVKEVYENDESGILCAGFYYEFMKIVNDQIKELNDTVF